MREIESEICGTCGNPSYAHASDCVAVHSKTEPTGWQPKKEGAVTHKPEMLFREQQYHGYVADERRFMQFDHSSGDISVYEQKIADSREVLSSAVFDLDFRMTERHILPGLIRSLGRAPTPAEVLREFDRQSVVRQVYRDERGGVTFPEYHDAELAPQQKVIEARQQDFPASAEEFETGPARIEEVMGSNGQKVQRLIITTTNQSGEKFDHPVMTTEELDSWVRPSAEMLARSLPDKKNGKVFIAGLGLGLLNQELRRLGVEHQVVAELNHEVIDKVGKPLQKENKSLDIRQGDFKQVLRQAIENGELFDAIFIDAFPNTADEVNRDASSMEVLKLAYNALKPGGRLTFYPDSRYISPRVLNDLVDFGIPESSIHYTMGKFDASDFTHSYHYGDLMAIPEIQKPLINVNDSATIQQLMKDYYEQRDSCVESYVANRYAKAV